MRRGLLKTAALTAAAMLTLTMTQPAHAHGTAHHAVADEALFEITDITRERFVIKLTDPAEIKHARDLVNGETTDRPHVVGRIIKRSAPYNPRWSYHFNPATIDFFDMAIEVCDATIPYVEDHLDETGGAFLPGLVWCPWTSRLVREIR
ncbi:twin-arginine translocation signal domain-containing protein [Actinomadura fulvescens]|uniref:BP74 N-terminal domain-containing protein n=1 Tax=Actinomadura fulvescens TaxID=46160 RepID=A0ABP6D6J7_9ACTN